MEVGKVKGESEGGWRKERGWEGSLIYSLKHLASLKVGQVSVGIGGFGSLHTACLMGHIKIAQVKSFPIEIIYITPYCPTTHHL